MNSLTRQSYLDNLRAVACIAVILLHISGPYLYTTSNIVEFQLVNFLHSLSRFCVPIFLMISGALLLGKKHYWMQFYKDRLAKIIKPLVFWSVFYILLYLSIIVFVDKSLSWEVTIDLIESSVVNGAAYHLWYMYLIIAIYLVLPFLSNFNQRFYTKHVFFLVLIWLFVLVLAQFVSGYKTVAWLRLGIGYFGYLILGYYCAKLNLSLLSSVLIFMLGLIGTFLPNYLSVSLDYKWYYYLNINVVLLSSGLFLIFKSLEFNSNILNLIAQKSFGIYFIHLFFIMLLNKMILPSSFFAPIQILVNTSLCLVLSYFTITQLKSIKFLAPYID